MNSYPQRQFRTARIYLAIFLVLLWGGVLVRPTQAQHSISEIDAMAGYWECKDPAGIQGISVFATTTFNDGGGVQKIISQTIGIRVYQRQRGKENWGFFYFPDSFGRAVLDGNHLTIHTGTGFAIPPFDMDLRFDPTKQQWSGVWSLCNTPAGNVLERPRSSEGLLANPLIGDWKGSQEPRLEFVLNGSAEATSTLHIRQSSDGKLIGWVDLLQREAGMTSSQHNGEEVTFRSALASQPAFELYDSIVTAHATYMYEGTLSEDGKTITGKWRINGGGIHSIPPVEEQVPTVFRRVN